MSTRILEDGTIVAGPESRAMFAAEQPWMEWVDLPPVLPKSHRGHTGRWWVWKSRRFKGFWVSRSPEHAIHYHPNHNAALQYVAAHLRPEVTG